ncbi:unnamed protein product, partial [Cyprideis torosa]
MGIAPSPINEQCTERPRQILANGQGRDDVNDEKTHFGYQTVDAGAKAGMVGQVFDSVATKYDVMNDMMSFGVHRLWKRFTIDQSAVRPGQSVLDIAGGTGDLA